MDFFFGVDHSAAPMLHEPFARAVPHSSVGRQFDPLAPSLPLSLPGFPLPMSGLPPSGVSTSSPLDAHDASELKDGSVPERSDLASLMLQAEVSFIRLNPFDLRPLPGEKQSGPDGLLPATVLFATTVFEIETFAGKSIKVRPLR